MKIWGAISNAVTGWMMILRGEPGWRERFSISTPGLIIALIIYACAAFLAVAIASTSIGMPSLPGVLAAMFVLGLPVIALVLTLLGTRMGLKSNEPIYPILVPGTYVLTAFLLIEGALAMIGGPVVMLAWVGLGYLLYRLARAATGWNLGIAAAFAVLTVVLLVAMRMALYMLSNPGT
ncbi:hypothetical protein SAMN05428969_0545 [Devosia sp. YR412]|uniref:hypothetical protein n=1 Tax=Devosia sp. YR412 TaxID=1881030 RepID=UPI0008C58FD4|nr:hypothetical protein [Devosia sp. YR412]SEP70517.1 hypothetical protein SAMN05428969_0545 [Devosia sp. YR412]